MESAEKSIQAMNEVVLDDPESGKKLILMTVAEIDAVGVGGQHLLPLAEKRDIFKRVMGNSFSAAFLRNEIERSDDEEWHRTIKELQERFDSIYDDLAQNYSKMEVSLVQTILDKLGHSVANDLIDPEHIEGNIPIMYTNKKVHPLRVKQHEAKKSQFIKTMEEQRGRQREILGKICRLRIFESVFSDKAKKKDEAYLDSFRQPLEVLKQKLLGGPRKSSKKRASTPTSSAARSPSPGSDLAASISRLSMSDDADKAPAPIVRARDPIVYLNLKSIIISDELREQLSEEGIEIPEYDEVELELYRHIIDAVEKAGHDPRKVPKSVVEEFLEDFQEQSESERESSSESSDSDSLETDGDDIMEQNERDVEMYCENIARQKRREAQRKKLGEITIDENGERELIDLVDESAPGPSNKRDPILESIEAEIGVVAREESREEPAPRPPPKATTPPPQPLKSILKTSRPRATFDLPPDVDNAAPPTRERDPTPPPKRARGLHLPDAEEDLFAAQLAHKSAKRTPPSGMEKKKATPSRVEKPVVRPVQAEKPVQKALKTSEGQTKQKQPQNSTEEVPTQQNHTRPAEVSVPATVAMEAPLLHQIKTELEDSVSINFVPHMVSDTVMSKQTPARKRRPSATFGDEPHQEALIFTHLALNVDDNNKIPVRPEGEHIIMRIFDDHRNPLVRETYEAVTEADTPREVWRENYCSDEHRSWWKLMVKAPKGTMNNPAKKKKPKKGDKMVRVPSSNVPFAAQVLQKLKPRSSQNALDFDEKLQSVLAEPFTLPEDKELAICKCKVNTVIIGDDVIAHLNPRLFTVFKDTENGYANFIDYARVLKFYGPTRLKSIVNKISHFVENGLPESNCDVVVNRLVWILSFEYLHLFSMDNEYMEDLEYLFQMCFFIFGPKHYMKNKRKEQYNYYQKEIPEGAHLSSYSLDPVVVTFVTIPEFGDYKRKFMKMNNFIRKKVIEYNEREDRVADEPYFELVDWAKAAEKMETVEERLTCLLQKLKEVGVPSEDICKVPECEVAKEPEVSEEPEVAEEPQVAEKPQRKTKAKRGRRKK
ncbi:hypothetical protein QR680_013656 [Steinernema hermaphroditum]|uniref:Uncharacterized protein n=1 Tax=Steinernema hermaphroditum TaxID=289476 RepID=A0AA39I8U4_9BILA|nr:hypothetical protein QR680_013656 [Steinernema hermaphroditum]